MRILSILTAIAAVSQAQTDCSQGACYPSVRNLLLGSANQLYASSTCGLTGSEVFCTPYLQTRMKCCPCDSRNSNGPLAHTVKDVLPISGTDRWWQSKKDVSPVTIQLDLGNLFQLANLVLSFKGPRPNAFVIERTLDNGRTWQAALYLATECRKAFPDISTTTPLSLDETYCTTLPPTGSNPYQDHTIEFSPLRQYTYVPVPNSKKIEDVSGLTGLRVRLTELGDVPRLPGRALSRFYALKEIRVMGSCMCHGHANQCLPEMFNSSPSHTKQNNLHCDCQHNTAGVNCEHCVDLYNDLPWKPAEEGNTHSCKRCECNNHAQRCHFDLAVYEASGRKSGGMCEDCQHHTTGPKCDQCAPGYQPNPKSRMDQPDACLSCVCRAEGTVNGNQCQDSRGSCQCKANVEGPLCDHCRRGYYDLRASNPLGCSKCSCSPDGSLSDVCDTVTGQCPCRPNFHGLTCERCLKGYWKPFLQGSCVPCSCDPTKSYSDNCDQVTGQCQCRPGFRGRTCTECPQKTYGDPLIGCQPCQCNTEGTLPEVCDKQTGTCLCKPGITGAHCNTCRRGHCNSFPACEICPICFFTLDAQRQNFSVALEGITPTFPFHPTGAVDPDMFRRRFFALETNLNLIQDSMSFSPSAAREVDNARFLLDKLKNQMGKINNDLLPLVRTPDQDSELNKLQDLLDSLTGVYNAKKDASVNSNDPSNAGAFVAIKNAYDESTDAAKKVNASRETLKESAGVRNETMNPQNQIPAANTRDLNKLNQSMASRPDLIPAAKQVCGSVWSGPCMPLQCEGGPLCPSEGSPVCEKEAECVGALPHSKRAGANAKDGEDQLDKISGNITEAAEKLQETQETTNQMRKTAGELSNKIKQTRDELEDDLKDMRNVVKELKDFLSDPSSNLTQIQEVSDWILKTKLPRNLPALLDELKNIAANLPDSTTILKEAEPQLETARKLLQDAQDARDTALGVKADVDGLLDTFGSVEESISDLEDKLENFTILIKNINDSLAKVKDQLTPAEKVLNDVSEVIKPMKPQLDKLKDLLQNESHQAQDAQDNADKAKDEADVANKDLLSLEERLDRLKDQAPTSGSGGQAGLVGDRLAKLQQDAGALANATENMIQAMEGKADSLRELQNEILQKSKRLDGLDAKLKDLLAKLQKKASDLSSCQG